MPRVALGHRREVGEHRVDAARPARHGGVLAEPGDRALEPVDERDEPPDEVDVAAGHVVERQDVLDRPGGVLGGGDARDDPVESGAPRVLRERQAEPAAVLGVEAPAHAAALDPVADALDGVVVQPESGPHGLGVEQVEHFGIGRAPAPCQFEHGDGEAQQGVGA